MLMGKTGVKLLKVDDIYKTWSRGTKCGRHSNKMNSIFQCETELFSWSQCLGWVEYIRARSQTSAYGRLEEYICCKKKYNPFL